MTKYSSYCCQSCGKPVGWLGRFIFPFLHVCPGTVLNNYYNARDNYNKKNNRVWKYECKNGHTWSSYSSPAGSYCASNYGMSETRCPTCSTPVCKGEVYVNGKFAYVGAAHVAFPSKRRGNKEKKE